jgi:hypothetical protein
VFVSGEEVGDGAFLTWWIVAPQGEQGGRPPRVGPRMPGETANASSPSPYVHQIESICCGRDWQA